MSKDATALRLWANFRHLSEDDKNLVLNITNLAAKIPQPEKAPVSAALPHGTSKSSTKNI